MLTRPEPQRCGNPSPSGGRRFWRAIGLLALAILALAIAFSALAARSRADGLTITIDQGLSPAFDLGVHDYVVRCTGTPLVVSVSTPPEIGVSVDHSSMRSGTFSKAVPLSEGQEFSIAVRQDAGTDYYYVRCLPSDFPSYAFDAENPAPPGMFTVDNLGIYSAIFDNDGVPVWWLKTAAGAFDSQVLSDGTYGFYDGGTGTDQIYSLSGQPIRELADPAGNTDVHELQLLSNGDYIIDAYVPRQHVDLRPYGPSDATILDCVVEEVAPDGHLVWTWSAEDHLSAGDTPQRWYDQVLPGGEPYDVFHLNSVEINGSEVVISMRHTDAVWGVDRNTGNILWKLGGTSNPHSLTIVGDPEGSYPLGGNHDARILPDGTLTVHDNNTGLAFPLRGVRYRINEHAHTATYLDSISDPEVPTSFCCGSARRLADGGWLTSWGGNPIIGMYAADGTRLFKLDLGDTFSYRAIPVPAGTKIAQVRAGMNAQYGRADNDLPPVARFGATPNPAGVGSAVVFDGSASDDPDGVVVSYDWDFGDGSAGSSSGVAHSYARPGDYLVRLTVTDDAGSTDTISHVVTVLPPNPQPPHASFVATPATAPTGTRIGFDSSSSSVEGDVLVSRAWRYGDGGTGSGELASHSYAHAGTYTVTLTVTGTSGYSAGASRTVRITDRPPTVSLSSTPRHPSAHHAISFTASAHDPDGHVVSYSWSFDDGYHAKGQRVRHAFARRGNHHVTVTVADSGNVSTRRTMVVGVR